jgi:hypothetical protein
MTMEELKKYCDEEFGNIEKIKAELLNLFKTGKTEYSLAERASAAAFIVNIYGGVENILKEMLVYDKLDTKDSPEWHEKVLKKANEIGILPHDLFQILTRYLSFRNFFIYSYIFNIKLDDIIVLADAISGMLNKFRTEIDEYMQSI